MRFKPSAETKAHAVEPAAPIPDPATLSYDQKMRLALVLAAKGDRLGATRLLEAAAVDRPAAPRPHQRLCAILRHVKTHDAALQHCRRWLELEPNRAYHGQIKRQIAALTELIRN